MKLYTVKDVREYTGLSRKQLWEFEKSIPPVARKSEFLDGGNYRGYKLYDQKGLDKLSMAALFSELGAGPQRINDIFGMENYDRTKVIDNLLDEAMRERQHLDDIITVTQELRKMEIWEFPYNLFQITGLHEMAEAIRKELERNETKRFMQMDKITQKRFLDIYKNLAQIELEDNVSVEEEKHVESLIVCIKETVSEDKWARILTNLDISLLAAPGYMEYVDKRIGKGAAEQAGTVIGHYIFVHFFEDFINNVMEDALDALEMDYDTPEVRHCVSKAMELIEKWYGIETSKEALRHFQAIKYRLQQEERPDDELCRIWDFFFGAFKYYAERE